MTIEKIKDILGPESEIERIVDHDRFLYVFFVPKGYLNPYLDERKSLVTNEGPLIINKNSGIYHYSYLTDFIAEFGENELFYPPQKLITWSERIFLITKRKYINMDDLYEFAITHNAFDQNEMEPEDILWKTLRLSATNKTGAEKLKVFLNECGAFHDCDGLNFKINRVIP